MKFSVYLTRRIVGILLILFIVFVCAFFLAPSSESKAQTTTDSNDGMPVMYLTTSGGAAITSKTAYISGTMKLVLNDVYAEYTNAYTESTGTIQIRGRGNSTWNGNDVKHSYKIKLGQAADLFGFGSSKHWVLLANYYEPTFLRNKMAYDFSGMLGMWYCESTWVVVYLNGEYIGLYQLCESIRVSDQRVNITDWEKIAEKVAKAIGKTGGYAQTAIDSLAEAMKQDLSWITTGYFRGYKISDYYDTSTFDITSGYLIEYDAFMDSVSQWYSGAGEPLMVDSPEYLATNDTMFSYVKELISDFEEAVFSDTFYNSKGKHYSEYVDMDSMVNYWMVQTVLANGEFGIRSGYFYIEDGLIHWGPIWDFDCGGGNHFTVTTDFSEWNGTGERNRWYQQLYGDPWFVSLLQQRWLEIRDIVSELPDYLESMESYIADAVQRDTDFYPSPRMWWSTPLYLGSTEYKNYYYWLKRRINWLDSQLMKNDPNIGSQGLSESSKMYVRITDGNGNTLSEDLAHPGDFEVDALCNPDSCGDSIKLTVSTSHTSVVSMSVYINGQYYTTQSASSTNTLRLAIPLSKLNLEEGAVNVILVTGNQSGGYYVAISRTIRMSSRENPESGQISYVLDDGLEEVYGVTESGSSIVLPTISVERDGFTAVGWTSGTQVYQPGTKVTLSSSTEFRVKWARTDMFSQMTVDSVTHKSQKNDSTNQTVVTTTAKEQTVTTVPKIEVTTQTSLDAEGGESTTQILPITGTTPSTEEENEKIVVPTTSPPTENTEKRIETSQNLLTEEQVTENQPSLSEKTENGEKVQESEKNSLWLWILLLLLGVLMITGFIGGRLFWKQKKMKK